MVSCFIQTVSLFVGSASQPAAPINPCGPGVMLNADGDCPEIPGAPELPDVPEFELPDVPVPAPAAPAPGPAASAPAPAAGKV